ncbi:MAG: bifunctional aminoglycoside phosphotransferase/ATP-binding protein [Thalassobaculales bacterium]
MTPDVAAFLADPATHGGVPVRVVETHGALVVLAGSRALKAKKAVAFAYMDFSTLARRRGFCFRELAVNRRTAPELYLGVRAVLQGPDGLRLGPLLQEDPGSDGEAVEWLVEMRRFDEATLFDRMAVEGCLEAPLLEDVARQVARFHHAAEAMPGGGAAAVRATAALNAGELRALLPGAATEALVAATDESVERLAPLLDRRAAEGHVRRCHGDLHLRNICLFEGRPTLFDAIEFNDDFAVIDTLYDVAFLLMDLLHRDLAGLASRAFNAWLAESGEGEGLAALPLFLSMRAAVRAHVGARAGEMAEAERYLALAGRFLAPAAPRLIAIGGLSGTGKTTLARALAPRLGVPPGAAVLRSDVIRKQRFGLAETERAPPDAYAPEVTARVFATIAAQARLYLAAGVPVVADAVYGEPAQRRAIAAVAAAAKVPFLGLWLTADPEACKRRVAERQGDASDATPAVVDAQARHVRPPRDWLAIDAGSGPAAALAAALIHVNATAGPQR